MVTAEEKEVKELYTKKKDDNEELADLTEDILPPLEIKPVQVSEALSKGKGNTKKKKRAALPR